MSLATNAHKPLLHTLLSSSFASLSYKLSVGSDIVLSSYRPHPSQVRCIIHATCRKRQVTRPSNAFFSSWARCQLVQHTLLQHTSALCPPARLPHRTFFNFEKFFRAESELRFAVGSFVGLIAVVLQRCLHILNNVVLHNRAYPGNSCCQCFARFASEARTL